MAFNDDSMKTDSGSHPDFGAIFMSNRTTIKECFERKLFGLPSSFAEFVKKVKTGMVLFLFEYEQRRLYGIFQAVSDGTMNIVPHAYHSSGKQFPAQVRFSVIWNCQSIFEHDFRDAIRDNYYAANKFNFGLSKDQVHRLLWLFSSRKVRVQKSLRRKGVKEKLHESSDKVNPLVDSGELGLEKYNSRAETQPRFSSGVFCSLDAGAPVNLSLSGSQSFPLQKEREHADVFSYSASSSLGDYIPLSSPEHSDPTEIENPFAECGNLENNLIESFISDCCKDLSLSETIIVPTLSGHRDIDHPSAASSPDRGPCNGNHQSVPIHLSDNYPGVRGLYSDTNKRVSVFSRLNLVAKAAVQENKDNSGVCDSVHEIMEELQQRHDNWKKTPRKPRQENGHNAPNKKASVFSRLNFTSKGSVQEKKVNTKVDKSKNRITEKFQGKKTREHEIFIGNHDDGENFSMTIHDMWSMERIEEQIPLVNLKCKGEMLKTACETERSDCIDGAVGLRLSEKQCKKRKLVRPMFRNQSSDVKTEVCDSCVNVDMPSQESSAGKENGGSCKVSTRSERIDHSEDGLSQKDIVPCMICPTICEGNSGEKGKGLIGKDSKLGEQGSAINNCLLVAVTEGLKTYQRRRCLSASPSIKDTEKEIVVDEGKMECYEAYTGTDGGGKCGEQNVDQVEVCLMKSENNIVQC